MIPVRRFLLLALPLLLLAGACADRGSEEIARVGEHVITIDDIAELYDSDTLPIDEAFRTTLFRLMARDVLVDAYEAQYGETLDPQAVEDLYEQRKAEIEAAGLTIPEALNEPNASEELLRFNSELGVLRRTVIDALIGDPEFLEAVYDDGLAVTTVCVRHILTATEEELEAAVERLEDGEDFATVADEVSMDTGTPGGDLGCRMAAAYVEPFAVAARDAEIGDLVYPVETSFGFHALIVDERTAPTFEELSAAPGDYVTDDTAQGLWENWLNDALQTADAEVLEARYGSWSPVGIVPPEA